MNNQTFVQTRLFLLAAVITVLTLGHVSLSALNDNLLHEQEQLDLRSKRLSQELAQWEQDVLTARTLRNELSGDQVEDLLRPTDTSNLGPLFDALAASSRLSEAVFSVTGPEAWDGENDFPGIEDIVRTKISLEAQAPADSDFWSFWAALSQLGGKWVLDSVEMQRVSQNSGLQALNIRVKASLSWYANAAQPSGGWP